MKNLILLLLLSLPCFAEWKVEIKNLQEQVTHGGEFSTLENASSWIADQEKVISDYRNAWGLVERVIPRSEASEDELNSRVLEEIPAEFEGFDENGLPKEIAPVRVRLKKTYTVVGPTDVTAQRTAERAFSSAMKAAEKAMECGKSTQALLLIRNSSKGLTTPQVKSIVATYSPIKDLLDTGSLMSAIEEIEAVTSDGVLVTEDDKTALINHINGCKP